MQYAKLIRVTGQILLLVSWMAVINSVWMSKMFEDKGMMKHLACPVSGLGFQTLIRQKSPYAHCARHCINLVIRYSCNIL